jgi:hypothetical protein
VAMDIVFQRKKQSSNRVKGVGVLSILAKVKNAKRLIFSPNCFNGLIGIFLFQQRYLKCILVLLLKMTFCLAGKNL